MSANNNSGPNNMRGMMNQFPRGSPQHHQQYIRNQNMQMHQQAVSMRQQAAAMGQFNPELFNNMYHQQQYPPQLTNMQAQQQHLLPMNIQPYGLIQHQVPPSGLLQPQHMLLYSQHQPQQDMHAQHMMSPQQHHFMRKSMQQQQHQQQQQQQHHQQQQHQQFGRDPMQHLQWHPQMMQAMNQQHMQPSLPLPPTNIRHPHQNRFIPPNALIDVNNQTGLAQASTSSPSSQTYPSSSSILGSQNEVKPPNNKALLDQTDSILGNPSDHRSSTTKPVYDSPKDNSGNSVLEAIKNISEEGLRPSVPYYDLPAGLIVPLISLSDREYAPIDPAKLRLPPPTVPSEKLLKAVDEFYRPQSAIRVDSQTVRDNDGWNRQFIDNYIKMKGQAMVEAMLSK